MLILLPQPSSEDWDYRNDILAIDYGIVWFLVSFLDQLGASISATGWKRQASAPFRISRESITV